MILSASRRTDIPTYYAEWLLNRLNEGFVFVRNPMNANQVSRIPINPDVVDCIVFWSKNPRPLMPYLDQIDAFGYPYYFQFTLTPYDQTIERNLPPKTEIEETFIELSQRIGKERMVWRYDPIFISSEWTVERHAETFEAMAERLAPYADECIISFIDSYRSAVRRMGHRIDGGVAPETMWTIAERFAKVAQKHDLPINTCAEEIELGRLGVGHASCIDRDRIERMLGVPLSDKVRADGQRAHCGCVECIDIGAYDTCQNGCLYCYATASDEKAKRNCEAHDPNSALLIGDSDAVERVTERKVERFREDQMRLW